MLEDQTILFKNELELLLKKYNAKLYPVNKNSFDLFQIIDNNLEIVVEIDNNVLTFID